MKRISLFSALLILLMFYRPQGLFGYTEITSLKIFQSFKGGRGLLWNYLKQMVYQKYLAD